MSEELSGIYGDLTVAEEQINGVGMRLAAYLDAFGGTAEEFARTEERLNLINRLKSKYGKTIDGVLTYLEQASEKLLKYQDYDAYLARLQKEAEDSGRILRKSCQKMHEIRLAAAGELSVQIRDALLDLNFLDVKFEVTVEAAEQPNEKGQDEAEFMICTNPGEPMRSLSKVASGGELSRIMLALKSVFAGKDEIETLIFDEIDVGVSGRTAQKVAEKMARIGAEHQVICITHLPQIAAMGDTHFRIEKDAAGGTTTTTISKLSEEECVEELARILGGAKITESVRENAREMKTLAAGQKNKMK